MYVWFYNCIYMYGLRSVDHNNYSSGMIFRMLILPCVDASNSDQLSAE